MFVEDFHSDVSGIIEYLLVSVSEFEVSRDLLWWSVFCVI